MGTNQKSSIILLLTIIISGWLPDALAEELFIEPEDAVVPVVDEIRFVGNETTQPKIMLQEMIIAVGDPVNARLMEKSRQYIMNLKLFKTVKAEMIEEDYKNILLITVDEKFYILPLPRVNRNSDGDIKAGGEVRWDNIMGLNQRLKVSWDRTRAAKNDINDKDKSKIDYTYPRMFDTPFTFNINSQRKTTNIEDVTDAGENVEAEQVGVFSGFNFFRWHNRHGPSRGLRYGAGMSRGVVKYKTKTGPDDFYINTRLVTLDLGVAYEAVQNLEWSRTGSEYGYNIAIGLRGLGSDQGHTTSSLYYRGYTHIFGIPNYNLNTQVRFGFSNFRNEALAIGGADSLRGYGRGDFTGNAMFLLNLEYLMPIWGYKPIRFLLFTDIGNTYPKLSEVDLTDLKFAIGSGLRWKVRQLVKTDLRLDVAYVPETGETRVIASTNETF